MNNDLISRKALLEAYDKAHKGPPGGARKLMEEAPAVDAVEVVRCKECKHFEDGPYDNGDMMCVRWGEWIFPNEDDFCSCGERKEK